MSDRYILESIRVDSKGRTKASTIVGVYKTIEEVETVIAGLSTNPKLKFNIQTDYTLFDHVHTPDYFTASSNLFTFKNDRQTNIFFL